MKQSSEIDAIHVNFVYMTSTILDNICSMITKAVVLGENLQTVIMAKSTQGGQVVVLLLFYHQILVLSPNVVQKHQVGKLFCVNKDMWRPFKNTRIL